MQVFNIRLALFLSCLLYITSCKNADKQTNSNSDSAVFMKTPSHTNIPGTHIFIIPPGGFAASTGSMKGFIKDEETTFLSVTEFNGKSFYAEAANNSAEKMRQQGYNVYFEEEKKIGSYEGRVMRIGDGETSTVWQLIFGDSSFSAMIMGIYPSGDEISGKQIATALETVIYDKEMIVDAQAGLNYSILPNESGYQYLKTNAGLAIYSLNGKADLSIPYVVVSQIPRQNGSPQSFAETSLESVLRNGFANPIVKSKGFLTINGNSAYEMEVECILKGRTVSVYIMVVAKESTAVMVQGLAKSNIKETLKGFKDFADAIKIK